MHAHLGKYPIGGRLLLGFRCQSIFVIQPQQRRRQQIDGIGKLPITNPDGTDSLQEKCTAERKRLVNVRGLPMRMRQAGPIGNEQGKGPCNHIVSFKCDDAPARAVQG